jgi:hypothetical protein
VVSQTNTKLRFLTEGNKHDAVIFRVEFVSALICRFACWKTIWSNELTKHVESNRSVAVSWFPLLLLKGTFFFIIPRHRRNYRRTIAGFKIICSVYRRQERLGSIDEHKCLDRCRGRPSRLSPGNYACLTEPGTAVRTPDILSPCTLISAWESQLPTPVCDKRPTWSTGWS